MKANSPRSQITQHLADGSNSFQFSFLKLIFLPLIYILGHPRVFENLLINDFLDKRQYRVSNEFHLLQT